MAPRPEQNSFCATLCDISSPPDKIIIVIKTGVMVQVVASRCLDYTEYYGIIETLVLKVIIVEVRIITKVTTEKTKKRILVNCEKLCEATITG